MPYWVDPEAGGRARWRLATVVALTLGTTGVRCRTPLHSCLGLLLRAACVLKGVRGRRSVTFNFLGRDFFNAISEKDAERFAQMLVKWLIALCAGIPVYVFRDYFQVSNHVHPSACMPYAGRGK